VHELREYERVQLGLVWFWKEWNGQLVVLAHAFQDCRSYHERGIDCGRHRHPRAEAVVESLREGTLEEVERRG
jgi:hypothetical protein